MCTATIDFGACLMGMHTAIIDFRACLLGSVEEQITIAEAHVSLFRSTIADLVSEGA